MTRPARRRTGLAAYAALVALTAYGGAIGLVTGTLDLGSTINARLPFDSPVFAAFALTVFVALPSTAVAWCAWRGDRRVGPAAEVAGVLLIAWIAIEVAFIRELSFFHPLYIVVGATFILIGRRASRPLARAMETEQVP